MAGSSIQVATHRVVDRAVVQLDTDYFSPENAPKRLRLVGVLNALLVVFMVLLSTVSVDIYAVAQGRIAPNGGSKVIQSLRTGQVKKVYVTEGSHVRSDDLVAELDATDSATERDNAAAQLDALDAEIARRRATMTAIIANGVARRPRPIVFAQSVTRAAQEREELVYQADLANLGARLSELDASILENIAKRQSMSLSIHAQTRLTKTLDERVSMWQSVLARGLASRSDVIGAEETAGKERTNLASFEGQLLSARAAAETARRSKAAAIAKFMADNSSSLADAQSKREQVEQTFIKASTDVTRARLIAPIDGTIQELVLTTIGQVVSASQKLMVVVPDHLALEVKALVANKDAGFLNRGQKAILKMDAFPSSLYGTVSGRVIEVAREAIDNQDTASSATGSIDNSLASSAFQSSNLVYPITVALDRNFVVMNGSRIPLSAGMTATVEIRTGRRRLIYYLFTPLHDAIADAGHER